MVTKSYNIDTPAFWGIDIGKKSANILVDIVILYCKCLSNDHKKEGQDTIQESKKREELK